MRRIQPTPGQLLAALCVCVTVVGCGGGSHQAPRRPAASAGQPFRFFSPQSFWNQPIPASAPIDPGSTRMVSSLNADVQREVQAKNGPWIDAGTDGVPIVTVPASQPTTSVTLDRAGTVNAAVSSAWSSVPVPTNAEPSPGEHDLAVWQPSTDRMWEFFEMARNRGHWEARWGGAMQHVSNNPGVYGSQAWPGAQTFWGVTATSLPLVGGAMTIQQLQSGRIGHALAIAIPHTRAGVFASPARRTDGNTALPDAVPEGARLRLDPHLDLSSLHLPRLTRMIAEAAQRYGIIVRDTGGVVSMFAQEPTAHINPYPRLYGGLYPYQLLAAFPWGHLQVLKLDLRRAG
jgi:hypothetical protein